MKKLNYPLSTYITKDVYNNKQLHAWHIHQSSQIYKQKGFASIQQWVYITLYQAKYSRDALEYIRESLWKADYSPFARSIHRHVVEINLLSSLSL